VTLSANNSLVVSVHRFSYDISGIWSPLRSCRKPNLAVKFSNTLSSSWGRIPLIIRRSIGRHTPKNTLSFDNRHPEVKRSAVVIASSTLKSTGPLLLLPAAP
jgi:hypothetical protein